MRSMTGFGRGTAAHDGDRVTVEVSSVNCRRNIDLRLNLPRELGALEPMIRNEIQAKAVRGCLTVTVSYELNAERRKERFRIDRETAGYIVNSLQALARETGISAELRVGDLLLIPGLVAEAVPIRADDLTDSARQALDLAIQELTVRQETEGQSLHRDLAERLERLRTLVRGVRDNADSALVDLRDRFNERVRVLGLDVSVDDERLAKEVALLAERSDIAEETVRLESHLAQFAELLDSRDAVGHSLDFLCQEMGREITTLCSKTRDTRIARFGVDLKAEVLRVKEQVQNVV
ncbi:MAG: YicC family protein [Lentisphaerae bacterium RIFOXYB12_FULL_65_16]|nr:MAG: YicC family protein [Lentisphaerae bacterium RIFOXYA12_64_32]OGV89137.1 MAG: YicC family protein [Lentisphaerae bacterium RIFOXYB12_FULL_65_16]